MMVGKDHALLEALTERERQVLALIAEGKTNAEIADTLGISFLTARNHVATILSKLGVHSRGEAAAWWRERPEPAGAIAGGWRRLVRALTPGFALGGLAKAAVGTTAVVVGATVVTATVALGVALNDGRPASFDLVNDDGTLNPAPDPVSPDRETVEQLYDWLRQCVDEGRDGEPPGVAARGIYKNAPDETIVIAPEQGDTYALCAAEAEEATGLLMPPAVLQPPNQREQMGEAVPPDPGSSLEQVTPLSPEEVNKYIEGAGLRRDALSPEQLAALDDGVVTYEEHEAAIQRFIECGLKAGFSAVPYPGEGLRPTRPGFRIPGNTYGVPNDDAFQADRATLEDCRMREWETSNAIWATQQIAPEESDIPEIYAFMRQCIAEGRRVTPAAMGAGGMWTRYQYEGNPITVASEQMGVYSMCALELEAETGWIAPEPEFEPAPTPDPDWDGRGSPPAQVRASLVNLDIAPEQRAILEDGLVTYEEDEQAWQHFYACAGPQVPTLELVPGEGKRPTRAAYTGPAGDGPDDWQARFERDQIVEDCADQHLWLANQVWGWSRPAPTAEEIEQFRAAMSQCLAEGRPVDPEVLSRDVFMGLFDSVPEPVEIASEDQLGTYYMCSLEIEAETGMRAYGPVIAPTTNE